MDAAYDHIQEESYPEEPTRQGDNNGGQQGSDFNHEFQEAYKAISSSPWAARLGGFLGSVKKQGEHLYTDARKEAAAASEQASKGLSSIINRTRSVSINQSGNASSTDENASSETIVPHPDRPESLPADIVREAENMLSRFRSEAAKRLKDIEKAEDAADEALLKFGANIRNFLRDAVTIAPPGSPGSQDDPTKVLFESKDSEGKRVIHTTRFDAQLHVIHSSLDSFMRDPVSPEWAGWAAKFDINAKTDAIAKDLDAYPELRRAMEKLVPEKVEYAPFWQRYYFLRHVIESEEQRRREMLKASAAETNPDEEITWGSDDDDEDASSPSTSTPQAPALAGSKETLKPAELQSAGEASKGEASKSEASKEGSDDLLKPARKSQDLHSQPDSDASYDLVSGATSRAPGSPREGKKEGAEDEESEEEDWE